MHYLSLNFFPISASTVEPVQSSACSTGENRLANPELDHVATAPPLAAGLETLAGVAATLTDDPKDGHPVAPSNQPDLRGPCFIFPLVGHFVIQQNPAFLPVLISPPDARVSLQHHHRQHHNNMESAHAPSVLVPKNTVLNSAAATGTTVSQKRRRPQPVLVPTQPWRPLHLLPRPAENLSHGNGSSSSNDNNNNNEQAVIRGDNTATHTVQSVEQGKTGPIETRTVSTEAYSRDFPVPEVRALVSGEEHDTPDVVMSHSVRAAEKANQQDNSPPKDTQTFTKKKKPKKQRDSAYGTRLTVGLSPSSTYRAVKCITEHPHASLIPPNRVHFPYVPDDTEQRRHPVCVQNGVEPLDVLFGRGHGTNTHMGNRLLRKLIAQYRNAYHQMAKGKKSQLAQNLTHFVRLQGGRFLMVSSNHGGGDDSNNDNNNRTYYYDCGSLRAVAKVKQALREGQRALPSNATK